MFFLPEMLTISPQFSRRNLKISQIRDKKKDKSRRKKRPPKISGNYMISSLFPDFEALKNFPIYRYLDI